MLDNQMYKAIKELREMQKFRLKSIDCIAGNGNGFKLEN